MKSWEIIAVIMLGAMLVCIVGLIVRLKYNSEQPPTGALVSTTKNLGSPIETFKHDNHLFVTYRHSIIHHPGCPCINTK